VFGYILTLLPNRIDAEDVAQQTWMVLWQKRDSYDPSASYFTWACGVARNEILNHMRRSAKWNMMVKHDALFDQLADEYVEYDEHLEQRKSALSSCIDKLPISQRELLTECYRSDQKMKQVAARRGLTADALYQSISRIRRTLFNCINRRLQRGLS